MKSCYSYILHTHLALFQIWYTVTVYIVHCDKILPAICLLLVKAVLSTCISKFTLHAALASEDV